MGSADVSAGDTILASQQNDLRDDIIQQFTAADEIFVSTGNDTGTVRTAITQALATAGTSTVIAGWTPLRVKQSIDALGGATIACSVYNDTTISVANATATILALNTENYDNDTMHDPSVNTRIKATTAGTYQILGSVMFASNSTGRRLLYLRYNGSGSGETVEVDTNQGGAHFIQISAQHVFTADQYVEMIVYQSSGGALDCTTSGTLFPGLAMVKV